eukprot:TRINITY_DN66431_c0_g1_i1.p1 TRINITY_DN66431_c0_g1~~TRINITY_DN66431_c0_g1_i1.p1  ORF type:complete len:201 (+),score=58.24 TRINITY_DN66431_c0_g1_i1:88-603(+)
MAGLALFVGGVGLEQQVPVTVPATGTVADVLSELKLDAKSLPYVQLSHAGQPLAPEQTLADAGVGAQVRLELGNKSMEGLYTMFPAKWEFKPDGTYTFDESRSGGHMSGTGTYSLVWEKGEQYVHLVGQITGQEFGKRKDSAQDERRPRSYFGKPASEQELAEASRWRALD